MTKTAQWAVLVILKILYFWYSKLYFLLFYLTSSNWMITSSLSVSELYHNYYSNHNWIKVYLNYHALNIAVFSVTKIFKVKLYQSAVFHFSGSRVLILIIMYNFYQRLFFLTLKTFSQQQKKKLFFYLF